MKPNPEPENERRLDELLHRWTVATPLPPRFQERVWQRIARAEPTVQAAPGFWAELRRLMDAYLPRPQFAYSYLGLLLLLGILGGAWAAQRESNRLDTALGSRYVQSLDPYQKVAFER